MRLSSGLVGELLDRKQMSFQELARRAEMRETDLVQLFGWAPPTMIERIATVLNVSAVEIVHDEETPRRAS